MLSTTLSATIVALVIFLSVITIVSSAAFIASMVTPKIPILAKIILGLIAIASWVTILTPAILEGILPLH